MSYSNKDRDWVSEFVSALRDEGIQLWVDVDEVRPGKRIYDRIQDALRQSDTLIVILSSNSADSPSTNFEIGAALADQKRIIPVLVGDIAPDDVPVWLRKIHALRATSPSEAGKRVAEVIEKDDIGDG